MYRFGAERVEAHIIPDAALWMKIWVTNTSPSSECENRRR